MKLYEVTEIDKEDQELLAYSGQTVEPTTPVIDISKKSSQVWKNLFVNTILCLLRESV